MGGVRRVMVGLIGVAAMGGPPATAGGLDCGSHWLNRAEALICDDPQLSRTEAQLARKLDTFAQRLNFGQYLGLRHWHAMWAHQRGQCDADRECILATYRAQRRFLDRLHRCVSGRMAQRTCLRDLVLGERDSVRR